MISNIRDFFNIHFRQKRYIISCRRRRRRHHRRRRRRRERKLM
jgi:hypothetical protein